MMYTLIVSALAVSAIAFRHPDPRTILSDDGHVCEPDKDVCFKSEGLYGWIKTSADVTYLEQDQTYYVTRQQCVIAFNGRAQQIVPIGDLRFWLGVEDCCGGTATSKRDADCNPKQQ